MHPERRRIDEALKVSVKPAGQAGEQGGDEKHDDLRARRVDAHRLGHDQPSVQGADGPTFARVQQIARDQHGAEQDEPDEIEHLPPGLQLHPEDVNRRNPRQPGVAAEEAEVAEQVVQADPPGDGSERQVVPGQSKRDQAEEQRHCHGERQGDGQRQPRGQAVLGRQIRARVRPEPDEGGLPERRQAADSGEQHEAERDERVQADVIEQRDLEFRQHDGRRGERDERQSGKQARAARPPDPRAGRGAGAPRRRLAGCAAHSSSSTWRVVSERHNSTGMISVKTMTSLKALAQNDEYDSSIPTSMAPPAASG